MGCDYASLQQAKNGHVSIHAPTWGATEYGRIATQVLTVSIHAPTWGATG